MPRRPYDGRVRPLPLLARLLAPTVAAASSTAAQQLAAQAGAASPLAGSVERILAKLEPAVAANESVRGAVTAIVAEEERAFEAGGSDGSLSGDVTLRQRARGVIAFAKAGSATITAFETELAALIAEIGRSAAAPRAAA